MSAAPDLDGAVAIAAAVRTGRRSAVEVVTEHLDRITASQSTLNAFTLVTGEAAIEVAGRVDAQVAAGDDPGPLAGVPVGVKDLIDQAGLPTTSGSSFPFPPAPSNATVIDRMEAAGAIVVGRTGLHEFAFGFSSENHWFGPVRNPWNTEDSPGGSSGGSAAAVAAGLVPVALGTDTGGSIRVPAALCGIAGLKVTHGRVPLTGVYPLAASLDTVGPLARTTADLAAVYAVIAGHDPTDPWSSPRPVAAVGDAADITGHRFVVPHPWVDRALTGGMADGWGWFLEALGAAGAEIAHVDVPELEFPGLISEAMYPEVAAVHRRRFAESPDGYGPEVRERVALAVDADFDAYFDGLAWRNRIREAAVHILDDAHAIITPTVAGLHKHIGVDAMDIADTSVSYRSALSCFSALVNHMELPAMALPVSLDGAPPASIQLIGHHWGESALLELGMALERSGISAFTAPARTG